MATRSSLASPITIDLVDPVAQLFNAVEETASSLAGNGSLAATRLDRPKKADFGDYSSNAAMLLAPTLGEQPRAVAERLGDALGERLGDAVERVEVAGPGFLNLFMADRWYLEALAGMLEAGEEFGHGDAGERVNVEFVSANPTGPITVASARHAAYGDFAVRAARTGRQRGRARVLHQRHRAPRCGSSASRSGPGRAARSRPRTGYLGEYVTELAAASRAPPTAIRTSSPAAASS